MSYVSYCHGEDQSGIFVLMEKEFNFYGATQGRGWMAVSGVLDTSPLGGGTHCSGSPRRLSAALSLANDTYFSPEHRRLFVAIVLPSLRRAAKHKGFRDTEEEKNEIKREITCSFQRRLHRGIAEALRPCNAQFSGGMKKVYVKGEECVL